MSELPIVDALVVSPPTPVWGAQLYLLDQAGPLAQRGIRLTLATPIDSDFARAWVERGLPHVDVPFDRHAGLRAVDGVSRPGIGSMIGTVRGIARNIRLLRSVGREFDMLYSFSLRSHLEVALAGRISGVPTALDLVDIVRPGLGRRVLRAAVRTADLTVANSAATADTLGGAGPTVVIHPGIDLDRFRPGTPNARLRCELAEGHAGRLIAVLGRLDEKKGVHRLVDAVDRLGESCADVQLIVVGEGGTGSPRYTEQLRVDAVRRLGERVHFAGRRSDVPEILRSVDVLVVASDAEPFGLTALEAQACGTVVVGTDAGGLPEFVEHDVTGLLVPPGDVEALAGAIERVLLDDELRARLVAEAERRARPARGLEAQYDRIANMYRGVASRDLRRTGAQG